MQRFFKNTKGAITVFVSLLLIPAVLVSGTAVDLSRIHTARSIVQDANQLAANSVLTQYEAMIQDIYGLYGVMESDPILGEMLNEYIQIAVFGEDGKDKELGTFQLFYGSEVETDITPVDDQNLRNLDVLRRQIEDYAKFRAPVIVMQEIWERIGKFEKLKADSDVIEQKIAVDGKVDEIDKIYKEIYNLINNINRYPSAEESAYASINSYLTKIKEKMVELEEVRDDWTEAFDKGSDFLASDLEEDYEDIKKDIKSLTKELDESIDRSQEALSTYIDQMDKLVKKCEEADQKKAELNQMVDDLEAKLNSGDCSDELVDGMTKPQEIRKEEGKDLIRTDPSVIESYRNLVSRSLKPMAEAMRSKNTPYINNVIGTLDDIGYGKVIDNRLSHPMLSRDSLKDLPDNKFGIDNIVVKRTVSSTDTRSLSEFAALANYKYTAPNAFTIFQDPSFDSTHNKSFYDTLAEMYGNNNDSNKEDAEESIKGLFKKAQDFFKEITLKPEGAAHYKVKEEGGDDSGFGNEGDWGNEDQASDAIKGGLNDSILGKFGDLLNDAGNKILLLVYSTEMFSNFTTVSGTKTMSGVPMSTDVNYFFQSELEYLYNGNEKSAVSNVATVSGLIFLVRFVFNYTSTFIIDEIKYELWLISAPAAPFTIQVRELARLGYALAESAIDMKELLSKPSSGAPLFKTSIEQWAFSLGGSLGNIPGKLGDLTVENKVGGEMYYIDYLRIFLLFQNGDTLAERTADLITWNITNKKGGINADEDSMATATEFDMSKVHTDFTITSKVDLGMLFLSMPFAQKGIKGVIPSKTIPMTVIDYRGY